MYRPIAIQDAKLSRPLLHDLEQSLTRNSRLLLNQDHPRSHKTVCDKRRILKGDGYSKGFSLMELLIVMAIIGILTAIALPSYRHYTEKARFTAVMLASQPYKTAVSLALQEGDDAADLNSGQNGIPPAAKSTKNLSHLIVTKGTITATASKAAGSYTYILTPDENGAYWKISGTCVKEGLCKN